MLSQSLEWQVKAGHIVSQSDSQSINQSVVFHSVTSLVTGIHAL